MNILTDVAANARPSCTLTRMRLRLIAPLLGLLTVVGCGGDDGDSGDDPLAGFGAEVRAATESSATDFPAVDGRSLKRMASELQAESEVGLATPAVAPGESRLAFGVITPDGGFVYGPTAVYVAPRPGAEARGPYPAPADPLVTEAEFRSKQAATDEDAFAAIYEAEVPVGEWKRMAVLAVTKSREGNLVGAGTTVDVVPPAKDPVISVGERAPKVKTDTVAEVGDIAKIDTRQPPDQLHESSFADAVGKRPVALLFATPALCETRVCGPVTDIALQLEREYGDRMEFIHQEVFVDNDPSAGVREPLAEFGLSTEPWLFVVDEKGVVTARLEGSFGIRAFERAVRSGID